jgi:hypothetical protein
MRSTALLFLLLSLFVVKPAQSQSNELLIQGQTGKLYLEHTVAAKENWYSIGRLYNISPKEVAPFNKLTMAQPLTIGQQLQIPLTAVNFSQNGAKVPAETLVPVYHIIQEKEWMYRISVNHNKVPIPFLEKWNNIDKDQVKSGMHLVVGFLKVKTALSALATSGGAAPVAMTTAPPSNGAVTAAPSAVTNTPANGSKPATTAISGAKTTSAAPASKVPPPTPKPVITATVAPPPPVKETPVTVKETPAVVKETPPSVKEERVATSASGTPALHFNGGYFKNEYTDGGKSASGPAGIFKSTSGWQDGKYYALMNNIPVGTIVRIGAASNGKSIYAKVLGQLPDMKESGGLTVRISNAAASELGVGEGKFTVEVRY